MKVLVYDNPNEHTDRTTGKAREITSVVEGVGRHEGFEVESTQYLMAADARLRRGDISLLVVHHYDFRYTSFLRRAHPKTKIAMYSRAIFDMLHSDAAVLKIRANYDYVMRTILIELPEIIKQLRAKASGEAGR